MLIVVRTYGNVSQVSFAVNDKFSSYTSLEEKIKQYEKERYVQFAHRDSRTLEMAKKRAPGRVACAKKEQRYPAAGPISTSITEASTEAIEWLG